MPKFKHFLNLICVIVCLGLSLLLLAIPDDNVWRRFLVVFVFMASLWVLEPVPLAITSMVPIFLFPLLTIMDTGNTSMMYLHESNMIMVGSLILSLAMQMSNLTKRLALFFIKIIGCNYRLLFFTLGTFTMLVSMFFSNTLVTAIMFPVARSILEELEEQGLAALYRPEEESEDEEEITEEFGKTREPTNIAVCFYLSSAFYSTVGAMGTPLGNNASLLFFNKLVPNLPVEITFGKWVGYNIIPMLWSYVVVTFFLMLFFTGLRSSNEAISFLEEKKFTARQAISDKLTTMGWLTCHEILVLVVITLTLILTLFRDLVDIDGWWEKDKTYVGDATVLIMMVILLFLLPSNLDFLKMFDPDETQRPKTSAPGLITWKYIQENMPWQTIFIMGGVLALGQALEGSEWFGWFDFVGDLRTEVLPESLDDQHTILSLKLVLLVGIIVGFTQFLENNHMFVSCNMMILEGLATHELLRGTMSVCLLSSLDFFLPVASSSNAIVAAWGNIRSTNFMKVGICIVLFDLFVILFHELVERM